MITEPISIEPNTVYSVEPFDEYEAAPVEQPRKLESNNRAFSRLDDKYLVTEMQLIALGKEYRFDGAPPIPVSNMGKVITQTPLGASQSGYLPPLPDELALTDYCVAQLPAIKLKVFKVNYVICCGRPKEEKLKYLKHKLHIRMSPSAWDHNLQGVRELVMVLRKSIVAVLTSEKV